MVYLFSHFIKLMFHLIYLVRSDEELILHVIWRAKINQYYCYYGFGSGVQMLPKIPTNVGLRTFGRCIVLADRYSANGSHNSQQSFSPGQGYWTYFQ